PPSSVLTPYTPLFRSALYCNYFMIATLQAAGVDVLFEQHGSRITDFRRGQALGPRDHLVRWVKPKARPVWMSLQQYRAFPKELRSEEHTSELQSRENL